MVVGKYAGQKISEVKKKVQEELIASGEATLFLEPEKKVISRSGDECVVALCDQWYVSFLFRIINFRDVDYLVKIV